MISKISKFNYHKFKTTKDKASIEVILQEKAYNLV